MKMRHNFIITIFFAVFMLGIFPKLAAIEENGEYALLYPTLLKTGKNILGSDLKNWHARSSAVCKMERGKGSPFSKTAPTLLVDSAASRPNYWGHSVKVPGGRTFLAGAWVKNNNAKILFWFFGNYGKPVRRMNERIYFFAGFNQQLKTHLSPESQALLGGDPSKWHLCYRLIKTPETAKIFYQNMMIGTYFAAGQITIAEPFYIDVTNIEKSGMTADIKGKKSIKSLNVIDLYTRDVIWSKTFKHPVKSFKQEIPGTDFRHGLNAKIEFNGYLMQVEYTDGSFASFSAPEENSQKHQI